MTAQEFNQRYGVGTSVNYHPVIGQPPSAETKTRSEAWTLPNGKAVVMVDGRAGCVALEAVSVTTPLTDYSHKFVTPQNCDCRGTDRHCMVCDGGLTVCDDCLTCEGGIPSDCPGEPIPYKQVERIYKGEVDYRQGAWIEGACSPHSPASYR